MVGKRAPAGMMDADGSNSVMKLAMMKFTMIDLSEHAEFFHLCEASALISGRGYNVEDKSLL
jgi:hypothetical protein